MSSPIQILPFSTSGNGATVDRSTEPSGTNGEAPNRSTPSFKSLVDRADKVSRQEKVDNNQSHNGDVGPDAPSTFQSAKSLNDRSSGPGELPAANLREQEDIQSQAVSNPLAPLEAEPELIPILPHRFDCGPGNCLIPIEEQQHVPKFRPDLGQYLHAGQLTEITVEPTDANDVTRLTDPGTVVGATSAPTSSPPIAVATGAITVERGAATDGIAVDLPTTNTVIVDDETALASRSFETPIATGVEPRSSNDGQLSPTSGDVSLSPVPAGQPIQDHAQTSNQRKAPSIPQSTSQVELSVGSPQQKATTEDASQPVQRSTEVASQFEAGTAANVATFGGQSETPVGNSNAVDSPLRSADTASIGQSFAQSPDNPVRSSFADSKPALPGSITSELNDQVTEQVNKDLSGEDALALQIEEASKASDDAIRALDADDLKRQLQNNENDLAERASLDNVSAEVDSTGFQSTDHSDSNSQHSYPGQAEQSRLESLLQQERQQTIEASTFGQTFSPASSIASTSITSSASVSVAESVGVLSLHEFLSGTPDANAFGSVGEVFGEAISKAITESKSVYLEVHPKELGFLTIHVSQTNEAVEAKIVASEMATGDMLMNHRDQLVETLNQLGFDSLDVDISFEERSADQFAEQQHERPTYQQSNSSNHQTTPSLSEPTEGLDIVA